LVTCNLKISFWYVYKYIEPSFDVNLCCVLFYGIYNMEMINVVVKVYDDWIRIEERFIGIKQVDVDNLGPLDIGESLLEF